MFVFVDESGTGDVPGPQSYFVLSAVAFQTAETRDGMEDAVKQLRREWRRKATFELKFAKLSHNGRTEFFAKVGALPFRFSSCVLHKDGLTGQWTDKRYVYERVMREVVGALSGYIREVDASQDKALKVRLVYDEFSDPDYCRILKEKFARLHSKDGSRMVLGVKPGRSRSSNLLQLADMVCGAARWDTNIYRRSIAAQQLGICHLP